MADAVPPAAGRDWDERYAAGLTWGDQANRWVVEHVAGLTPGVALDLAAGDGRHTAWLAARGWRVIATDVSRVAAAVGRARTAARGAVAWVVADAARPVVAPRSVDLALVAYLHLPAAAAEDALRGAAAAVRPGGTLVVVGHDATNLRDGVGGPQDPTILASAHTVAAAATAEGLLVRVAHVAEREVEGAPRTAKDTVVVAERPSSRPE